MKRVLTTVCLLLATIATQAQELKFNKNGTFKIAQLTDVHFKNGHPASQNSLNLFDEVIRNEKPDLVILSGDIVIEPAPVADGWEKVLKPFRDAKIPVAVTLGNHDHEHDLSREQVYELLAKKELCYSDAEDFVLEIEGKGGKTEALLYLFDSNDYSTNERVGGYGWITSDQVNKYIETSEKYTRANKGEPLPALAYFHIPLPEYTKAYENPTMPAIGSKGEDECGPEINTGLFAAMVESGDVMGTFVGHDHVNDYMAYLNGIALSYGRASSLGTTYGDLTPGSRIVILHEGERRFDSYIYELGGQIVQRSSFPRKLTFAITSDTHFDMPPESDQWRNVAELNRYDLDGVAIVGDMFDHQHPEILELFRRRYEQSGIDGDSTIRTQVYLGLGNHDVEPVSHDPVQNEIEKSLTLKYMDSILLVQKERDIIESLHKPTRNYSFDLSGMHFIQTNTWAGDTILGEGGLEWLAKDLKEHGSKGEPIVLLMHYTFNPKSMRWINEQERKELAKVLKGYNIKAIFNGHDHHAKKMKWEGFDVYQTDNTWPDTEGQAPSFWIIHYTEGGDFEVEQIFWQEN